MRYNDKSKNVRALQLALIKAGYELHTFGADGHLGEETWEALKDFALDNEFVWAPEIEDSIIAAMVDQMAPVTTDEILKVPYYDLIHEPIPAVSRKKFNFRAGNVVKRVPTVVDGITIHQAGIQFGVNKRQIARANGNQKLALAQRVKKVACHAFALDGFYAKTYPLEWYIYHGNGLNRKTLGLEIDGLYPGLRDDPITIEREDLATLWEGTPTSLTDSRVKAARAALRYLVEEGRKLGMPIKYIYAHRQSSSTRRSDPGEEIWRKVVTEYGVAVLGLETRTRFTTGMGRPIPDPWDADGRGPY